MSIPNSERTEKLFIKRAHAVNAIKNYNKVGRKIPLEDSNTLSGFSFELEDLQEIVAYLENHGESACKRVFFGLIYHEGNFAETGSYRTGYGLVAAPMVRAEGDCGKYEDNNVPQDGWRIPDDAKLYNYCEPCPPICPKIKVDGSDEPVYFNEI